MKKKKKTFCREKKMRQKCVAQNLIFFPPIYFKMNVQENYGNLEILILCSGKALTKVCLVKISQLGKKTMILITRPKVLKSTWKNTESSVLIANSDMP